MLLAESEYYNLYTPGKNKTKQKHKKPQETLS